MKLTLRHLEYLSLLCQYGHFSQAAEAAHVSQPALSVAIAEVEAHFGAALIDRTHRPYRPTPLGQDVLQQAETILSQMRSLENTALAPRGVNGAFRLGLIPTIAPFLLPIALEDIHKRLTSLDLELREAQTHVLLDELMNGNLDAAVLATPCDPDFFQEFALFEDHFYLVVSHSDAIALGLVDGQIEQNDMAPLKLLLLEDGHCLRDQTAQYCRFASREALRQVGASSLHTLCGLAQSGYGATLVPELCLEENMVGRDLSVLRLAPPSPHRQIRLVIKRSMSAYMDISDLQEILTSAGERKISMNHAR